jgi:hypothetical protein
MEKKTTISFRISEVPHDLQLILTLPQGGCFCKKPQVTRITEVIRRLEIARCKSCGLVKLQGSDSYQGMPSGMPSGVPQEPLLIPALAAVTARASG